MGWKAKSSRRFARCVHDAEGSAGRDVACDHQSQECFTIAVAGISVVRDQYDLKNGRPNPYAGKLGKKDRTALVKWWASAEGNVRMLPEDVDKPARLRFGSRSSS